MHCRSSLQATTISCHQWCRTWACKGNLSHNTIAKHFSLLLSCSFTGDHHQLPPVVQNMAFQKYSHLDQSLFARFIRLGTPYVELNAQVRRRPCDLVCLKWQGAGAAADAAASALLCCLALHPPGHTWILCTGGMHRRRALLLRSILLCCAKLPGSSSVIT
jgi:hypothetical protein